LNELKTIIRKVYKFMCKIDQVSIEEFALDACFLEISELLINPYVKIRVKEEDVSKWSYFIGRVNENKFICSLDTDKDVLTITFKANPDEGNILQGDLRHFYEMLQKRYFEVNPSVRKFSVLIKPTHRCNMNCKYCYDKPFRDVIKEDMTMETLDKIIYLLANYCEELSIIWHGGEPTMVGVQWYEFAQKIINKYPMLKVTQSMMSNGINLNDDWLNLFLKYNISIGVSYDVFTQEDTRNKSGQEKYAYAEQPTIRQEERIPSRVDIFNTLKYFKEKTSIGTINVITNKNCHRLIETYEIYKQNGIGTCMNTLFKTAATESNELSLDPEIYAEEFLKYFKHWLYDPRGVYERSAMEALGYVIGSNEASCTHQDCRRQWLGFNPAGQIYPCDRYYPDRYKCGHLDDFNSVEEIFSSEGYRLYYNEVQERFDNHCQPCGYWEYCKGGCNATMVEETGSASGVSKSSCVAFKLIYNGVYKILRDVSLIDDEILLNPVAHNFMIKKGFFTVKEINQHLKELGVKRLMIYDENDLLNCTEHKVFRKINYLQGQSAVNAHVDFVRGLIQEKGNNWEKRRNSFLQLMKGVVVYECAKPGTTRHDNPLVKCG